MAYRMTEITDRVRVGINRQGDFNIEVWDRPHTFLDAEVEQVFVPADAASDLGKFLLLKSTEKKVPA